MRHVEAGGDEHDLCPRAGDPSGSHGAADGDRHDAWRLRQAVSALATAGMRTPEDIAVVGFDDFANMYTNDFSVDRGTGETGVVRQTVNVSAGALSLTTVHAPFREMGRYAVQTLLALLHGEPVPPTVMVPTELIVRHSCGCRPTASLCGPAGTAGAGPYDHLR